VENTPVHISPPIGIYPVQVKVMQGKVLGGLKISIFWRKFRVNMLQCVLQELQHLKGTLMKPTTSSTSSPPPQKKEN